MRARLGLLCLAALASAPHAVTAQASQPAAPPTAGRGFFQAGYLRIDPDGLNGDLANAGLPSLSRDYLTLGGGGYGTRGRFLLGGEGHGLMGRTETTVGGARQVSTAGGYGLFRVGYLAVSTDALDIYPIFGIGGGGISLKIAERAVPTFDQVLSDPERSATLSTAMLLLDVAAAANYRVTMEDDGSGGFLLGIQFGYTFAPAQSRWKLDGINDVAGGPSLKIQGPYLRLSIGGWGREDIATEP